MIPISIPNLSGNERKYLNDCVDSNFVSSVGPYVTRFEKEISVASGATHAVALSSGTCGLHLALRAVGTSAGDLVIIPDFTFIATANAVSHCGAIPWIFDVSESDWNLDCQLLGATLKKETERRPNGIFHRQLNRRISAIMPVCTFGLPPDLPALVSIGQEYDLPIVCDAAAALGSEISGKKIGQAGPILTVFSFNGNKTITTGGGGAVVGCTEKPIRWIRHVSTTARRGPDYDHDEIGYNYRMTNVQAAIGCAQIENLNSFLEAKQRIRHFYEGSFKNLPGAKPFPAPAGRKSACWLSGVFLENRKVEAIIPSLRARGLDVRTFWKPISTQRPYSEAPRTRVEISTRIWDRILILPCSTQITENEGNLVVEAVRAVLNEERLDA